MRRKLYFCAPMLLAAGAIAAADETSTTASVAKAAEMPAQDRRGKGRWGKGQGLHGRDR
jgi:hypothetical protein